MTVSKKEYREWLSLIENCVPFDMWPEPYSKWLAWCPFCRDFSGFGTCEPCPLRGKRWTGREYLRGSSCCKGLDVKNDLCHPGVLTPTSKNITWFFDFFQKMEKHFK